MGLIKDVLFFWPRFFEEGYLAYKFYKAAKSIEPELNENGLRIDWIGRIYTVLNLKEEALQQPDVVQQSMIFQSLSPISDILLKYGMSDDAFPSIEKISKGGYLVVLYPENDYFTILSFIKNTILLAALSGIIYNIASFV